MKKKSFKAIALITGLLCVASAVQAASAADAATGKSVYTNKCRICHGADGEGGTGYAKAMGLEPARLGSDRVQKKTDAELRKIVLTGSGKMKPINGLSESDIDNVIAYIRTFRRN